MSVETVIAPGDQVVKDPAAKKVWVFNWDTNLPTGAQLAAVGTFTVSVEPGYREVSISLAVDSIAFVAGSRKVQFRLTGGRAGVLYRIAHHITTNETPAQEDEQSFLVLVQDL